MLQVRGGDPKETLGAMAERLGEPVERICDAIDANKILNGKPAYINSEGFVYVEPYEDICDSIAYCGNCGLTHADPPCEDKCSCGAVGTHSANAHNLLLRYGKKV